MSLAAERGLVLLFDPDVAGDHVTFGDPD